MNKLFKGNEGGSLKEKRVSTRYSTDAALSYKVMGDFLQPTEVITVRGKLLDISNTGMRFELKEKPPKRGGVLCVQIDVNFANAIVTIPILVEIKWVKESSVNKYSLGSRFMM